jgi:serine protease AprX
MSLSNPTHYQPVDDAVHNAVVNGVVVVCSAGNTGPYTGSIKCPSDSPDAITVGSTDVYDRISTFSSRGPTWDGRTKPDLVAIGEGVISARASGAIVGTPISQYYSYASGTSASCPQISAACAILLDANPDLSPVDVKNALLSTVSSPECGVSEQQHRLGQP